jgi:ketosteroid isomerase-like protein
MTTETAIHPDLAAVQAGFQAFGAGDLAGFGALFADDATWNHRNDDRLGGIHRGRSGILDFIVESGRLTAGTLRAVPLAMMADGTGLVAAQMRVTGERPDGRTFDDVQMVLFRVEDGLVTSVDQFVGDPAAVTAFWA